MNISPYHFFSSCTTTIQNTFCTNNRVFSDQSQFFLLVQPPFFSPKILRKTQNIRFLILNSWKNPFRICWKNHFFFNLLEKNGKKNPQPHRETPNDPGLALQVALNPLCDLAGYALAPASVIAPVTGMDIARAAQLTQLVGFQGKVGNSGQLRWEIWSFLARTWPELGVFSYGYGSIPIHTIFRGMNIHLPAILMFTRGIGFWPIPIFSSYFLVKISLACGKWMILSSHL